MARLPAKSYSGFSVAGAGYWGFALRVNGVSVGNRVYGFVFALGMYIMSTLVTSFRMFTESGPQHQLRLTTSPIFSVKWLHLGLDLSGSGLHETDFPSPLDGLSCSTFLCTWSRVIEAYPIRSTAKCSQNGTLWQPGLSKLYALVSNTLSIPGGESNWVAKYAMVDPLRAISSKFQRRTLHNGPYLQVKMENASTILPLSSFIKPCGGGLLSVSFYYS